MDVDSDNSRPSSEAPDIIEVFEDIEGIGDSSGIDEDQEMAQQEPKTKDQPQQEGQSLEQRLADEIRLRKFTEDVLDSRQMELERQEMHNEQLLSQLDELRKELSDVQEQLSKARSEIASKDNQISEVKDQIFRLQPTRKDITESEAVEAYRALCGNVQRWVDNRLKTILDDLDHGRLQTYSTPHQAGRFVSLMREAAKRGLSHDQSDTYHVIAVIMSYLCIVFFSKSFYSPLDDYEGDATCVFIDELEATMSELPRDASQCREWRSETLTALTSQQSFKTRQIKYINLVSGDLADLLSVVVPRASTSDLQSSLRRAIVEPAAELAHQLHLAPSVYSLKWTARGAWSRLEVYECLDLANGGQLMNLSGTRSTSPSRRNVSYLFDVAPGLFVERVEGRKKSPVRAICRPTVLTFSGEEEVAEKPTVVKWLWDSADPPPGQGRLAPSRAATPSRQTFPAAPVPSTRRR